jgi:hypothetical protein
MVKRNAVHRPLTLNAGTSPSRARYATHPFISNRRHSPTPSLTIILFLVRSPKHWVKIRRARWDPTAAPIWEDSAYPQLYWFFFYLVLIFFNLFYVFWQTTPSLHKAFVMHRQCPILPRVVLTGWVRSSWAPIASPLYKPLCHFLLALYDTVPYTSKGACLSPLTSRWCIQTYVFLPQQSRQQGCVDIQAVHVGQAYPLSDTQYATTTYI